MNKSDHKGIQCGLTNTFYVCIISLIRINFWLFQCRQARSSFTSKRVIILPLSCQFEQRALWSNYTERTRHPTLRPGSLGIQVHTAPACKQYVASLDYSCEAGYSHTYLQHWIHQTKTRSMTSSAFSHTHYSHPKVSSTASHTKTPGWICTCVLQF